MTEDRLALTELLEKAGERGGGGAAIADGGRRRGVDRRRAVRAQRRAEHLAQWLPRGPPARSSCAAPQACRPAPPRTVRNFVRRLGMIGRKEPNDAATQRPSYPRRCSRPAAGWRRSEDGFRP